MKKILIFGCNEVTDAVLPILCADTRYANEICIASGDKACCDVLKKKYSNLPVRITTARADVNNESGIKMMLSIISPDLIVNLEKPELTMNVMKIALFQGADYIDTTLYQWENKEILSKQFELFGDFRSKGSTAVTGCALNPAVITSLARSAAKSRLDSVEEVDVFEVNLKSTAPVSNIKELLNSVEFKAKEEKAVCIRNGATEEIEPLSLKIRREVPDVGVRTMYLLNNPIVEDFLKEIPEVPNVRYFSTFKRKSTTVIDTLRDVGMLSDTPVEIDGVKIAPIDFLSKVMPVSSESEEVTGKSAAGVFISGMKDGAPRCVMACASKDNEACREEHGVGVNAHYDALALAAGIKLICTEKWKRAGVYTPSAFDPDLLLDIMRKDGFKYSLADAEPIKIDMGDDSDE